MCLKGQQKDEHEQGPATGNKTSMDEKPGLSLLYLICIMASVKYYRCFEPPCISISKLCSDS